MTTQKNRSQQAASSRQQMLNADRKENRMNMQSCIKDKLSFLRDTDSKKAAALEGYPEGSINVNSSQGHVYYDYVWKGGRRRLRMSDPEDYALACALAQKDYDQKVLKRLTDETKALEKLTKFLDRGSIKDIYDNLSEERKALVEPVWLPDDEFAERWQQAEIRRSEPVPDNTGFLTERGERVRSKSEVFIANALYKHGIKYFYEICIDLTDHRTGRSYTAHPDFCALNLKTRSSFLWEHLGMMDDPDYAERAVSKLADYENAGFLPGRNMILTFETSQEPFSPEKAEAAISGYLNIQPSELSGILNHPGF